MREAYIIDAVRTPVGKRGGGLSQVHPADLGAHVLRTLVQRTGIDPLAVEDVFLGCVDTVGPQAGDIARTARRWLSRAKRSMSWREQFHFSAIISAERNCDISCVP